MRSDVRSCLAVLVAACVVPALLASVFAIGLSWRESRTTLSARAAVDARLVASAVDHRLEEATRQLQMLSVSPSLAADDLAAFRVDAERALPYLVGTNVVLTGLDGQQRMNTSSPPGAPLPRHGDPAFQRRVIETGQPQVSGLFIGGLLRRPLVVVEVPVRRGGRVVATLAMGFLPAAFDDIVHRPGTSTDRAIIAVIDAAGIVVARSREAQFVGHPAVAPLREAMKRQAEGYIETPTLEGVPGVIAYTRSAITGWHVAVAVPRAVMLSRLERWTTWLAAGAFVTLAIGLTVAALVARRIAGAIRALLAPAADLGRGKPVAPRRLVLREADEVASALSAASSLLRSRTQERDQATEMSRAMRQQAEEARHSARRDPLTGLANRAHFLEELDAHVHAHREGGGRFCVLFVDIDDFKPVNDLHGHATGDELLQAFAGRLLSAVRGQDLVARLGGDEFAVLVDERGRDDVAPMLATLSERLSMPYHVRGRTLLVEASIGVAAWPEDGATPEALLETADAHMYRMKSRRKGGFGDTGPMPF